MCDQRRQYRNRARRVLTCVGLPGLLLSAAVAGSDSADAELEAMLEVLAEETELATRTRMNADFVPGIVTVLDGALMRATGARRVEDALALVPGLEPTRDVFGQSLATVRGIPFPFNSGNVLVMVNGVPMARDSAGGNSTVLSYPLSLVERIEVVRGPGSVIYGEFAFQGVINVITRTDGHAVGLEHDDRGATQFIARTSNEIADELRFDASAGRLTSDEGLVVLPRRSDDQRSYAVVALTARNYSLRVQHASRESDDNGRDSLNVTGDERSTVLDGDYRFDLSGWAARGRVQYLLNDFEVTSLAFDGSQWRLGFDMERSLGRHRLLAGVEWVDGLVDSASFAPPPLPGLAPQPMSEPLMTQDRQLVGLYAQDQITLRGDLELTIGARFDDNSEVGQRVTPRLAMVYRASATQIFKLQYAEGYRSPTFFELYSTPVVPELDFEVNRTIEFSHVWTAAQTRLRSTLYATRLDDMVYLAGTGPTGQAGNVAGASAHGVEFELGQRLASQWRLLASASWVASEDDRGVSRQTADIAEVRPWLVNAALVYTPRPDLIAGLRFRTAATRDTPQVAGETRPNWLDLHLSWRDAVVPGLNLSVGATNVLGDSTVYLARSPTGTAPVPYDEQAVWVGVDMSWD